MKNADWKTHLKNRLKITGFVLALVGWLMLITVPLEEIFNKDLSGIETFFETGVFKWGIRIVVLLLLVALIKGGEWIREILNRYKWLRIVVKGIVVGGVTGWVVGLGSLLY